MKHTYSDIAGRLASRAELVCKFLLPKGEKDGQEWKVGGVGGEKGGSLGVRLSGERAGRWLDRANDSDKGDLLTLWSVTKGVSLRDAYKEACGWLNIVVPSLNGHSNGHSKPNKAGVRKLTPEGGPWTYLTGGRRLLRETLDAYKVSEREGSIIFPYLNEAGEAINLKTLSVERDGSGKKITRLEKGCALSLFGWQAIPKDARTVVITEGEIDAMTWFQWGSPALSVPNGCSSDNWIDHEWENLAPFEEIYLSFDMDDAGQRHVPQIARRLGLHRCRLVSLPFKDANECLQKGHIAPDAGKWLGEARYIAPSDLVNPDIFTTEVNEYFRPPGGKPPGFCPSILGEKLYLRPGETTLLTGTSGHGKSTLWSQFIVEAACVALPCLLFSMEMPRAVTFGQMARQFYGVEVPGEMEVGKFMSWLGNRVYYANLQGMAKRTEIQEIMEYAAARHGIRLAVIDSLMKLDLAGDDYNGQRDFMNWITQFSANSGCHTLVVAHPRKGRDESEAPGKMDIKGSSDLFNQADNVMGLWRNKQKEEYVRGGNPKANDKDPDARVYVDKQRRTGVEFDEKLWFHRKALQYRCAPGASAACFSSALDESDPF